MSREYDASEKKYLWILYVIIIAGTLIQILCPEIKIMWGGIAASELLYYIFLRELQLKFDEVTGVRNRICFERHLMSVRQDTELFLVELDINHLKVVNDIYGHAMGDQFSRDSAQIIKTAYADCGKAYRIGGDEFAVIAAGVPEEKVEAAKNKMLKMLAQKHELKETDRRNVRG